MSMNGRQIILDGYKLPDLKKYKDYREFQDSDDGPMIQVPTLRESELFHPFYGKLTFNRKLFKHLKGNFDNKVAGREIPLQAGHGGFGGDEPPAHGWVKDLKEVKTDDGKWNLYAFAQPTELGFNSIRNGDFRYASIAYVEHYFDNDELATILSEEGTIDFESKKVQSLDRGPTTLHIALTNTPFVDKQERVRMFTNPNVDTLDKVYILPEIEGLDWSTVLSEKNATTKEETKESDVKEEKTEDVKTETKIETTEKPEVKKLDKKDNDDSVILDKKELQELRLFRDRFEKAQVEIVDAEIESASEKALTRGVAKTTVEFIKTIMKYSQRDDALVFKMTSITEKDGKPELSVTEYDNLYTACKKMLSDVIPSNVKIKNESAIAEHSQGDEDDIDYNSKEEKAKAKAYAALSDPSILLDAKKGN